MEITGDLKLIQELSKSVIFRIILNIFLCNLIFSVGIKKRISSGFAVIKKRQIR